MWIYLLATRFILYTSNLYVNTQEKSLSTDRPSLARVPTVSRRSGWASPKRKRKALGQSVGHPSPKSTLHSERGKKIVQVQVQVTSASSFPI